MVRPATVCGLTLSWQLSADAGEGHVRGSCGQNEFVGGYRVAVTGGQVPRNPNNVSICVSARSIWLLASGASFADCRF